MSSMSTSYFLEMLYSVSLRFVLCFWYLSNTFSITFSFSDATVVLVEATLPAFGIIKMELTLSLKSTSPIFAKSLSESPKLLAFGGLIPLLTVNPKILISLKLSKLNL